MNHTFPIVQDSVFEEPAEVALQKLKAILQSMQRVLVAFSGGVDSALVLDVAFEVLGQNAVAITAISPTFPPEEQEISTQFTSARGIEHILVESHELEDEGYARNEGNRCYFCKSELFHLAHDRAQTMGVEWVLDGTIVDDLGDHRPGLQAASEKQVRHPLVEAGFTKSMVRQIARNRGIHLWNKPSFACLGSRFMPGTRVTLERIQQVQQVETHLRQIGFVQFRARWHAVGEDRLVRIELGPAEFALLLEPNVRQIIVEQCKTIGFRWVTLDLLGYQDPTTKENQSATLSD